MSILLRSRICETKIKVHGMLDLFIIFFIMRWLIASYRYRLFNKRELISFAGNCILQGNVLQNLLIKHDFKTCNSKGLHCLERYHKRLNNYSSRFGKIRLWLQEYMLLLRGSWGKHFQQVWEQGNIPNILSKVALDANGMKMTCIFSLLAPLLEQLG